MKILLIPLEWINRNLSLKARTKWVPSAPFCFPIHDSWSFHIFHAEGKGEFWWVYLTSLLRKEKPGESSRPAMPWDSSPTWKNGENVMHALQMTSSWSLTLYIRLQVAFVRKWTRSTNLHPKLLLRLDLSVDLLPRLGSKTKMQLKLKNWERLDETFYFHSKDVPSISPIQQQIRV